MKFMDVRVPDKEKLPSLQKLCDISEPYQSSKELDLLFLNAMKEVIAWHSERSNFYKTLLERKNFKIDSLNEIKNISDIPFIHANFFKRHEVLSIPKDKIILHLTSSGTTGQKSQMFFDEWSIECGRRMVDFIYDKRGWYSNEKANYLLFAYEPTEGMKLGTTNTNVFLTKYAPVNKLFYGLRYTGHNSHEFDIFGCIEKLQRYQEEGLPVRIFGFPAFMYFMLKRMRDLSIPNIKLPVKSMAMFGGGWKGYADQAISKNELYSQIHEQLGIDDSFIGESFGSVEHSIPYIECKNHNLHVPVWSRVLIRDVETLEVAGYNKPGFLNFISPYITSVPANSVFMGDLAETYPAEECKCGSETPFFRILGRAGVSRNKSCAVAASELLKGK